jgi:hypothetical protein
MHSKRFTEDIKQSKIVDIEDYGMSDVDMYSEPTIDPIYYDGKYPKHPILTPFLIIDKPNEYEQLFSEYNQSKQSTRKLTVPSGMENVIEKEEEERRKSIEGINRELDLHVS